MNWKVISFGLAICGLLLVSGTVVKAAPVREARIDSLILRSAVEEARTASPLERSAEEVSSAEEARISEACMESLCG